MGRLYLTHNDYRTPHYRFLGRCHSYYSPVGDSALMRKAPALLREMRENLRNTQLRNVIKGLKINFKYAFKLQSQLSTLHLRYKARNQTVMFDAEYLLRIKTERKTDQILLKTIKCTI